MTRLLIGVLALQGAYAKHAEVIGALGAECVKVRKPKDLEKCEGLIIPGGESTAILRQINFINLGDSIAKFAEIKPVFGTCAGLILMAKEVLPPTFQPFGLLDVTVERNAYGRQAESFNVDVELSLPQKPNKQMRAIFIRAPKIRHYGSEIKVLALYQGEPILVQQGIHLGSTFHPELTEDDDVHRYFLEMIRMTA